MFFITAKKYRDNPKYEIIQKEPDKISKQDPFDLVLNQKIKKTKV